MGEDESNCCSSAQNVNIVYFLNWKNLIFDVDSCPHLMKVECKALSEKLLTMVNQPKKDLKMTR